VNFTSEENTFYNLDRSIASFFGCPPQETISSMTGRAAKRGVWYGVAGRYLLDHVLSPRALNHCENAIIHADALDKVDDGKEQ